MKKKFIAMMLTACISLTGCGMYQHITDNGDKSVTFETAYLMTDEELEEKQYDSEGKYNVDGTKYNMVEKQVSTLKGNEITEAVAEEANVSLLSSGYFSYLYIPKDTSGNNIEDTGEAAAGDEISSKIVDGLVDSIMTPIVCEVTFTDPIICTNKGAKLSDDKKTVTWIANGLTALNKEQWYAYTAKFKKNHKPTVRGVKDGMTYMGTATIKFKEVAGVKVSATLNGKNIKSGKKVNKNGQYELVVTNSFGNSKTVKFTVAKKAQ